MLGGGDTDIYLEREDLCMFTMSSTEGPRVPLVHLPSNR